MAVKAWPVEQEPGLAEEIFLDLDPHTGIRPGERWKQALLKANTRCEAVVCLLSKHWESSSECKPEYRHAADAPKWHPLDETYWRYCRECGHPSVCHIDGMGASNPPVARR